MSFNPINPMIGALAQEIFNILIKDSGLRDYIRTKLGRDPFKLALQAALTPAYSKFVEKHHEWSKSLFDEHFFKNSAAPILACCLIRDGEAEGIELATAWCKQIRLEDDLSLIDELEPIASEFLDWFEEELRKQPEFQSLFDSRALDETAGGVTELVDDIKNVYQSVEKITPAIEKITPAIEQLLVKLTKEFADLISMEGQKTLNASVKVEALHWLKMELWKQPEFQSLFDLHELDETTTTGATKLVDELKNMASVIEELPSKLTEELVSLIRTVVPNYLKAPVVDKILVPVFHPVDSSVQSRVSVVGKKINLLPTGYQPPLFSESVYDFRNRTQDMAIIFSFLESNPYLHLYGPSGIGKTYLAVELLKKRYSGNHKAYLDFNEHQFRSQSRSIEHLLREVQQQFYNTDIDKDLSLDELIANLAQKAKQSSGYGIIILDNIHRIAPSVRRQLCEEILPSLEHQIADPKRYLRIIAVAQTQIEELRGSAKPIYFQPYFLAEFGGMNHDYPTYKGLLMQAIERFASDLLNANDRDDDNLLRNWAYALYCLTGGHPSAIEGTLNYIGLQKMFAKYNVFEEQRKAICESVLAPLIEQQVQACLPDAKYQKAFQQLWIFRYLSKGVFRQVLRTVKNKDHWSDLNAITGLADYDPKYAPLWQRLIETPLLQSEGINRSRLLSHQLSPIWRKQGNLILQVTDPALYQTLHRDAFNVFDHFVQSKTTRNINIRISCFVEALYHLTQQNKIPASDQNRSDFTKKVIDDFDLLILLLEEEEDFFDENLYLVKKLLQSDQELQAELNQVGTQDTYQQISNIIRQKISYN